MKYLRNIDFLKKNVMNYVVRYIVCYKETLKKRYSILL